MAVVQERLHVVEEGGEPSHLDVRLERPAQPRDPGLVVLYLHGFGSQQTGDKANFFRLHFLRHGLAFCSFDFQGHGDSGGEMFDLTLSRNLADMGRVHGFLRVEGFERLVLFGSSMGGATALWYAALHPQDIAAGVHIAPALGLDQGLLNMVGAEGERRWRKEGQWRFTNDLVTCDLSWNLIEDLRSFEQQRLKALYRTPTLLLQGKKDTSVLWRSILDFTVDCEYEGLELHLMADGDHRLVDRLPHLWALTKAFLEARGIVQSDGRLSGGI